MQKQQFNRQLLAAVAALAAVAISGGERQAAARDVIYANDGGGFSAYYRSAQSRLFSALEDSLSQQAEDALVGEFSAIRIRRARVDIQSPSGGRKAHLGVNLMGAFTDDVDSSHAIGWQFRGYAGQDNRRGLNAGVFVRGIRGDTLFGGNVFADYERHDTGGFWRYSVGGEVRNRFFSIAANYYVPITDEREGGRVGATSQTVAFSPEGYDAKLRISIPHLEMLKAAADYYHYDGKYGAADDSGLRYGVEVNPSPDVRVEVFYDNGGKEVGGEISYSHTIGEENQHSASAGYDNNLFSAVWREHAQRIVVTTKDEVMTATVNVPPLAGLTMLLFEAAATGNVASLSMLIAAGLDVNIVNGGQTPLYNAAFFGRVGAVSILISAGASVNIRDNFGFAPLHLAATRGHGDVISVLVAANADVNTASNVLFGSGGDAPLHNAVVNGKPAAVSALVAANGINVNIRNARGETPLQLVARSLRGFRRVTPPSLAEAEAVLSVLVTATGISVNIADNDGRTPLHDAADEGHASLVSILLTVNDINVNATDTSGFTPLDFAIGGLTQGQPGGNYRGVIAALTVNNGECGLTRNHADCPNSPPPPDDD